MIRNPFTYIVRCSEYDQIPAILKTIYDDLRQSSYRNFNPDDYIWRFGNDIYNIVRRDHYSLSEVFGINYEFVRGCYPAGYICLEQKTIEDRKYVSINPGEIEERFNTIVKPLIDDLREDMDSKGGFKYRDIIINRDEASIYPSTMIKQFLNSTYGRNDRLDAARYAFGTCRRFKENKEDKNMNKINYQRRHVLTRIEKVIFNDPVTVVIWDNGTKTIVRAENEPFDPEKGLAMAISKYFFNNEGYYYDIFRKWLPEEKKNVKKTKKTKEGKKKTKSTKKKEE